MATTLQRPAETVLEGHCPGTPIGQADHIEVGAGAGEVEKFVCITYELEFLGLDDSSVSAGTADEEDQTSNPRAPRRR